VIDLDQAVAGGTLGTIDLHFARLLMRMAEPEHRDTIALTAALLGLERGSGHSCVAPDRWEGKPFPGTSALLPALADWEGVLEGSALVGDGSSVTPIVRDPHGRVYLYRYWQAEQRVAASMRARMTRALPAPDHERLAPLFRELFVAEADRPDWQAVAAAAALAGAFSVVSGGPGTGKTTTVTRILALLVAAEPDVRIGMAAPTGKAAARLAETIAVESARLGIAEELRARLPTEASTLHRLLGARRRTGGFRHHAGRPLALDVLVVDEASMIDLVLMDAVMAAVRPDARLILLGDRDQLASVETGFVFGEVCRAAAETADVGNAPTGDAQPTAIDRTYAQLSGREAPPRPAGSLPSDCVVELRHSYRFDADSALGAVARAIRDGDADAVVEILAGGEHELARLSEVPADPGDAVRTLCAETEAVLASDGPAQALARLATFRILCATRLGARGAEALGEAVERKLAAAGHATGERWYRGRPVMITANDYQVGLFNGDIGVCWPREEDATMCAFFDDGQGGVRAVPLSRLPEHVTAWAMTVHKSQGSEFDRVVLVLADEDSPLCTRELLYTGVTRARRAVEVVASVDALRACVSKPATRRSGLLERLTEP